MKTSKWLFVSLIAVVLSGCTLPTGGTPAVHQGNPVVESTPTLLPAPSATQFIPPDPDTPIPALPESDTQAPTAQASDTPEGNAQKGSNEPVSFNIPSQNDPVPAGVLDQLSWTGKGGGNLTQVCGNCNVSIEADRISFSGFQPSQELKALIYRSTGANPSKCADGTANYVTTLSILVDGTGKFSAILSGPTQDIIVVSVLDGKTGEKIWKNYNAPYEQWKCSASQSVSSCPGAPPQRLKVNQMASICTSKDPVKLREGPGKNFSTLKMLVSGADVTIIGGPTCADNWSWWQVRTESGFTGWMSEGGDKTDMYFLCPKP